MTRRSPGYSFSSSVEPSQLRSKPNTVLALASRRMDPCVRRISGGTWPRLASRSFRHKQQRTYLMRSKAQGMNAAFAAAMVVSTRPRLSAMTSYLLPGKCTKIARGDRPTWVRRGPGQQTLDGLLAALFTSRPAAASCRALHAPGCDSATRIRGLPSWGLLGRPWMQATSGE